MHFVVREEYAGLEFDVSQAIWSSSSPADYWQGIKVLLPDTATLLLHTCAHTTSDWLIRRGRLYQIGDIQILAAVMGPDQWAALDASIGPADARYVYPALAFAQKYACVAIPEGLMERLRLQAPAGLRDFLRLTDLATASQSNPETRAGIGLGLSRVLARSPRERIRMVLRSLFPRRWNLATRYPKLVATPIWPLCYVLINASRVRHFIFRRARSR
jgi:hypothetical protein